LERGRGGRRREGLGATGPSTDHSLESRNRKGQLFDSIALFGWDRRYILKPFLASYMFRVMVVNISKQNNYAMTSVPKDISTKLKRTMGSHNSYERTEQALAGRTRRLGDRSGLSQLRCANRRACRVVRCVVFWYDNS
jgi:hypothetical protein